MMRLFIFFLISLLGLAAPPDFSGVWRLDVEKSQFDRQAPPRVAVDRIEHHEPYLVMHSIRAYGDAQQTPGPARHGRGYPLLAGGSAQLLADLLGVLGVRGELEVFFPGLSGGLLVVDPLSR